MLAQSERGLSCFLVPRFLPDGSKNRFFIQRLKDKLGNRSNASSEIELEGAWAQMIGEEGRGVPTIVEMVNHTRLDCVLGSTALMQQALSQAAHPAAHRSAFGKKLLEQPLMRTVLADLTVEVEAAQLLAMRLAEAYDKPEQAAFRRIATAVGKFWVCKRAITTIFEALESLGGAGYVEESPLPRLYREAPVNSVWEGSGNVIALDVLRAMNKEPETVEALRAQLHLARGQDKRYDAWLGSIEAELGQPQELEAGARRLVSRLAMALQASLLLRHGQPAVAAAFCASRLDGGLPQLGALPAGLDLGPIVARATPLA
jgi:putative acyl-CoA dehydrogenase